ncbi:hypothetical protein SLEP1_g42401 [Rubroshorea leprosula]|uniref:Endonuclease/exonuclease/phosphatase domain-containing protein n=1 Tax=Rubroshorea leprosula TaxID=152421 RepID=A0AAV5L9P4_9ROSI|nr:hypothetical protein SLEP1_g42401 [Rubroshorea leprosula]
MISYGGRKRTRANKRLGERLSLTVEENVGLTLDDGDALPMREAVGKGVLLANVWRTVKDMHMRITDATDSRRWLQEASDNPVMEEAARQQGSSTNMEAFMDTSKDMLSLDQGKEIKEHHDNPRLTVVEMITVSPKTRAWKQEARSRKSQATNSLSVVPRIKRKERNPWAVHSLIELVRLKQPSIVLLSETLLNGRGRSSLPWLVGGDFNDLSSQDEKMGGMLQPDWMIHGFRDVIDFCGLTEVQMMGGLFTWKVFEKLDRGFVTLRWMSFFP